MNNSCNMIQDLLPLYHDSVCSEDSKKMVEEHLNECQNCKEVLRKMKNTVMEDSLQQEYADVIVHHNKQVRRKTAVAGMCMSAILMIPVIVCLIVNLATGHGLDWFFIVLTSLLVFASITVVPLMVEENRWVWTIAAFTAAVLILLMTCSIYTGGDWFAITAVSVLFGMTVLFMPYVFYALIKKGTLSRCKALLSMGADTVMLFVFLWVVGIYVNLEEYWRIALPISSICTVFVWIIFLIIRYLKLNVLAKAGICVILCSIANLMLNDIIKWLTYGGTLQIGLSKANLLLWNAETVNPNIGMLVLIIGCPIGIILLLVGIFRKKAAK